MQVDEQVDSVLWEITEGQLGKAPAVPSNDLKGQQEAAPANSNAVRVAP